MPPASNYSRGHEPLRSGGEMGSLLKFPFFTILIRIEKVTCPRPRRGHEPFKGAVNMGFSNLLFILVEKRKGGFQFFRIWRHGYVLHMLVHRMISVLASRRALPRASGRR